MTAVCSILFVAQVYFADMAPQEPEVVFQGASTEACGLAMGLLRLDPRGRTSAENALRHRFVYTITVAC